MKNQSSKCASVYNINMMTSIRKYIEKNPLVPLDPILFEGSNITLQEITSESTLRYINMGSGTTGTISSTALMCNNNITSMHWTWTCGMSKGTREFMSWTQRLDNCLKNLNCKSNRELLIELSHKLYRISHVKSIEGWTKYFGLSDTPADAMYPYILPIFNFSVILQTIREPNSWWNSRRTGHHEWLFPICKLEYWNRVKHPFDIIGCLRLGDVPQTVLMTYKDYKDDSIVMDTIYIEAYKKMTMYNSLITPSNKLHIMCLWDNNRSDADFPKHIVDRVRDSLSN